MNVDVFLREASSRLTKAGIENPRLDCLVLLEDILKIDRSIILAHPETQLTAAQLSQLNKYITQRIAHMPLAYIRGKTLFYGRQFKVNQHVLVPRPETEVMIEMLKQPPLPAKPRIADIGTGSGCIGITAALELPGSIVDLYDVDSDALTVAKNNVRLHQRALKVRRSDLLADIHTPYDVLLANLPYVPQDYEINKAAQHEPLLALFAGQDGLDVYRSFWQQLTSLQTKPTHIFTEALPAQHDALIKLANSAGFHLSHTQGFIQHFAAN